MKTISPKTMASSRKSQAMDACLSWKWERWRATHHRSTNCASTQQNQAQQRKYKSSLSDDLCPPPGSRQVLLHCCLCPASQAHTHMHSECILFHQYLPLLWAAVAHLSLRLVSDAWLSLCKMSTKPISLSLSWRSWEPDSKGDIHSVYRIQSTSTFHIGKSVLESISSP